MRILAIDLGGTNLRFGIYNPAKKGGKHHGMESFFIIKTPKSRAKMLSELKKIIKVMRPDAIGMSLPGVLDYKTGAIIVLPNLRFMNGFNISKFLRQYCKKVLIDNDAKCSLRAEKKIGRLRGYKNAMFVTVGTGIGGAILIDGKIYYGRGGAGEIGHTFIEKNKTLEHLAAGPNFKANWTAKNKRIISEYLGVAVINIEKLLDVDAIVFGGGVMHDVGARILPAIKRNAEKNMGARKLPDLLISHLGGRSAIIGAGMMLEK
ncbi:ROK family protein [Patescibacteria group bacterium]|nr:ROK family protein [Patescibacteria group bacterium]